MTRLRFPVALTALAALVSSLALSSSPVRSQSSPVNLVRGDIETKGKITDLVVEDLDGDGNKDLLIIMGREIRLHFFSVKDGGFRPEPDQRFKLDPRAILFDVGDLDGDGKKEIVLLREDGVFAHRLDVVDGRPFYALKLEKLIACETLLRRASDDEARRKEFVKDVDGDGRADILVAEREGFAVHRGKKGPPGGKLEFEPRAILPTPPVSMIDTGDDKLSSSLLATYWIANPTIADWDADGRSEIVLAQEGDLAVFKPGLDGTIPRAPVLRQEIPGTKSFSLDAERPFELDFTMPLILRDLNHDGRVDAALTHVGQGTTRIFMNSATPAEAFKIPTKVVRAKGITFIAFFADLNGDGLDDMILPRMDKIGIWSILKVVVTRSVPVEAQFFYQRKEGSPFPDEPDYTRQFEIPVALHSKGEGLDVGTTLIASVDGDFDGDGKKDLLYRTGPRKLSIFPGLGDRRGIAETASTELEIRNSDDYRFVLPTVEDVNGDGLSDIVLRYFSWDRKDDRLVTFLSRRR